MLTCLFSLHIRFEANLTEKGSMINDYLSPRSLTEISVRNDNELIIHVP